MSIGELMTVITFISRHSYVSWCWILVSFAGYNAGSYKDTKK